MFDNSTRTAVASANVTATDAITGDPRGFTTSGAGGVYTLLVTTGGVPPRLTLSYSATGLFRSDLMIDRPVDGNVIGGGMNVWSLGDAPLWNSMSMDAIYALVGQTRDNARGTMNIAVRDCADRIVEHAHVDIQPPPGLLAYQASDGTPAPAPVNETVAPFAHVIALNADATSANQITVTADGYTFQPVEVVVGAGQVNTLVVIHAD
jgi:hypothetical protein